MFSFALGNHPGNGAREFLPSVRGAVREEAGDAGVAGNEAPPGLSEAHTERSDGAETGHDYAAHGAGGIAMEAVAFCGLCLSMSLSLAEWLVRYLSIGAVGVDVEFEVDLATNELPLKTVCKEITLCQMMVPPQIAQCLLQLPHNQSISDAVSAPHGGQIPSNPSSLPSSSRGDCYQSSESHKIQDAYLLSGLDHSFACCPRFWTSIRLSKATCGLATR